MRRDIKCDEVISEVVTGQEGEEREGLRGDGALKGRERRPIPLPIRPYVTLASKAKTARGEERGKGDAVRDEGERLKREK